MASSKFIRHTVSAVAIAIACTFGVTNTVNAQIPTTDIASIMQDVMAQAETIAKWVAQAKQIESQITEAKNQVSELQKNYQAITGARGMGNFLNNPNVASMIPDDLSAALAMGKSSGAFTAERAKYPTFGSKPKLNAMYDVIAGQNVSTASLYSKTSERLTQVKGLMSAIDTATDPAAKQDLMNRLVNEQNSLEANKQAIASLQANQKIQLDNAAFQASREFKCSEFKNC